MQKPSQWKDHLNTLVLWTRGKGYHIEFVKKGEDSVCRETRLVEINSSNTIENQVYYLLHECGHILIFKHGSHFDYEHIEDNYEDRTSMAKVHRVIEETEAWRRGKALARRLNLPIDDIKWRRAMTRSLKRYMEWAT